MKSDFDFGSTYGEAGQGFIECHHRRPVSELEPGSKTWLDDLASQALGHSDLNATLSIYGHQDASDLEGAMAT